MIVFNVMVFLGLYVKVLHDYVPVCVITHALEGSFNSLPYTLCRDILHGF